jgi:VIT1/CCC1 family predicted Fe2+/Mn2+ transporter
MPEQQKGSDTALAELDREIAESTSRLKTLSESRQENALWWTTDNAMTISSAVLIFGALVMVVAALLIRSGKSAEALLRIFGTILIVISALFLVVAGYSDKQIAPVMGLLGTIAGYLLGKDVKEKE